VHPVYEYPSLSSPSDSGASQRTDAQGQERPPRPVQRIKITARTVAIKMPDDGALGRWLGWRALSA